MRLVWGAKGRIIEIFLVVLSLLVFLYFRFGFFFVHLFFFPLQKLHFISLCLKKVKLSRH